jgi:ferredoxin-nitrite reductase
MLTLTRDQNITLHNVALGDVSTVRQGLAGGGLHVLGEGGTADIRACTGSAVCALGITDAPGAGHGLAGRPSLLRNSALRVFVSGCPNSCAQHQIADIGLAGSKVRVDGHTVDGYQVFLGADLERLLIGEVVGRVAAGDVGDAIDAVVGTWEALRHGADTLGVTVRRVGLGAFAKQIGAALDRRWAAGPEPAAGDPVAAVTVAAPTSRAA